MNVEIVEYIKKRENIQFSEFIDYYCSLSKRNKTYIRYYRRLQNLIKEFEESIHKEIYTDSFTPDITEKYIFFLKSYTPLKREHDSFRQSTMRCLVQRTITMLNKASKYGYRTNVESFSSLQIDQENIDNIYLTMNELERINNLPLDSKTAQIRDIFLIGCLTALRYCDYIRLTKYNFHPNGNINILTKKTHTKVTIPTHYIIKEIIDRNDGFLFLKYTHSLQNFNKVIKNICKKAKINDQIYVERTEGFKMVTKVYQKYQLVTSHTARRSGATNMYLAGIPAYRIMMLTGHKSEITFFRYIKIRKEENAFFLQNHPFFTKRPMYNE